MGSDASVLGVSEIVKKANYVGDGYGFENKEYWEDKVDIVGAPRAEAKAAGEVALAAFRLEAAGLIVPQSTSRCLKTPP